MALHSSGMRVLGILLAASTALIGAGTLLDPATPGDSTHHARDLVLSDADTWRAANGLMAFGFLLLAASSLALALLRHPVAYGPASLVGWSLNAFFSVPLALALLFKATVLVHVAQTFEAESFGIGHHYVTTTLLAAMPAVLFAWLLIALDQVTNRTAQVPGWAAHAAWVGALLAASGPVAMTLDRPDIGRAAVFILLPLAWFAWHGLRMVFVPIEEVVPQIDPEE